MNWPQDGVSNGVQLAARGSDSPASSPPSPSSSSSSPSGGGGSGGARNPFLGSFKRDDKSSFYKDSALQAIVVDAKGDAVEELEFSKAHLVERYKLQNRDVRALDASFRGLPSILVRDHALVVNLELVRALISPDELVIFGPWHPDVVSRMVPKFCDKIKSHSRDALPYEFLALERILKTVHVNLDRRLATFSMSIDSLLQEAHNNMDPKTFGRMLPFKYSLSAFEMTVREISNAIKELLRSDEDMASAYLTVFKKTGHRRRIDQHDELELLLETYLKGVEEIQNEVTKIRTNITATEDMISIELDSLRNEIMRADLILQIGTFAVSSGALAAGVFGMNLLSGMENHPYAFYMVAGTIVGSAAFIARSVMRVARRKKIL